MKALAPSPSANENSLLGKCQNASMKMLHETETKGQDAGYFQDLQRALIGCKTNLNQGLKSQARKNIEYDIANRRHSKVDHKWEKPLPTQSEINEIERERQA